MIGKVFSKRTMGIGVLFKMGKEGLDTFLEDKKQWDFSYS